jgi:hypothetical protein
MRSLRASSDLVECVVLQRGDRLEGAGTMLGDLQVAQPS